MFDLDIARVARRSKHRFVSIAAPLSDRFVATLSAPTWCNLSSVSSAVFTVLNVSVDLLCPTRPVVYQSLNVVYTSFGRIASQGKTMAVMPDDSCDGSRITSCTAPFQRHCLRRNSCPAIRYGLMASSNFIWYSRQNVPLHCSWSKSFTVRFAEMPENKGSLLYSAFLLPSKRSLGQSSWRNKQRIPYSGRSRQFPPSISVTRRPQTCFQYLAGLGLATKSYISQMLARELFSWFFTAPYLFESLAVFTDGKSAFPDIGS